MADDFVRVNPDGTGKLIDTVQVVVGANTVERQRIAVGGANAGDTAQPINASPVGTEYALPVRNIPSGTQPVSGSVSVGNFPATQPVTAASLPLPTGASQDGTDGAAPPTIPGTGIRGWLRSIYDRLSGTLATSRTWNLAGGTDTVTTVPSGTQAVSGAVDVSDRAARLAGHVTVDTAPSPDVTDRTARLLGHVTVDAQPAVVQGAAGAAAWKVDGSAVVQPVSAAALPLPAGAGTEATLSAIRAGIPLDDQRFEYYLPVAGVQKPRYIGWAPQGTATSAAAWTVQQYTWSLGPNGTDYIPTIIEVRSGSWDNRATLGW